MVRVPMNAMKTTDIIKHGPDRKHNLPPESSGLRNADTQSAEEPKTKKKGVPRIGG